MTRLVTGEISNEELNKLWNAYKYESDVSELKEDLGVSKANEAATPKKPDVILPMPQSATPAQKAKPEVQQRPPTPVDEVFEKQVKNRIW
jgi:hypothetical protein